MNENFDQIYKALFRRYYSSLIFYATRLTGGEEAEDVVQDVFVELWKRRDTIEVGDQIQAFLYRAVYTRCLNVLKHRNIEMDIAPPWKKSTRDAPSSISLTITKSSVGLKTGNCEKKFTMPSTNCRISVRKYSNSAIYTA